MGLAKWNNILLFYVYIHSFKVDGHDPAVCQKACCADSGCVAWTFADPQPLLVSAPLITYNYYTYILSLYPMYLSKTCTSFINIIYVLNSTKISN